MEPAASRRPLEPDSNLLEVESATVLELRSSADAGAGLGTSILRFPRKLGRGVSDSLQLCFVVPPTTARFCYVFV